MTQTDDATGPLPTLRRDPAGGWSPSPGGSPDAESAPEGVAPAEPSGTAAEAGSADTSGAATGGRHAGEPRRRGRVLLAAGGAVLAVTVGILAMNLAAGSPSPGAGPGPTVASPADRTSAPQRGAPAGAPGAGTQTSAPPAAAAAPAGTPAPGRSASSGAASLGAAAVPPGAPSVTVLNQTGIRGLGAAQATRITSAGWTVRRVTDVRARVQETTVYYESGQQAAAQVLLRTVPTVRRAQPHPSWLLRTGGLIVVVAR